MRFSMGIAGTIVGAALAFAGCRPSAQDYPTKNITLIVPFAAGGPTDVISRIIGEHMSRTLGHQLIIENVVGAGGTTASTRAKRAAPDGYTLITGHMGTHAASVALYPKLQYDPRTDFEPIGLIAGTPILVLAKKDFPPKDLKEFVTYVKANETKLNNAHAGVGSVSFTTCLLLNSIIGVKPTTIPFNGTGPSMNALVGGQVDYMCDQIVNAVPQVKGGTIKAYAIATAERNPSLPDVPTTKEAGPAGVRGLGLERAVRPEGHAQGGRRQALRRALQGARRRGRAQAPARPRQRHSGPDRRGPAALSTLVKSEVDKWGKVIKEAGAEVN